MLTLDAVPKLLGRIKEWHTEARVIAFKLETNENLLVDKIMQTFDKYEVDAVIGNILETRN